MRKITDDAFYGLNRINLSEIIEVSKMLRNKSLFRYDGVKMQYETDKVEQKLSDFFKQKVLCVNNGTSALKLCLLANNIGSGDEVIVPCLSFIATAACCLTVGAIPVFCEINNTFNIDPKEIEKNITKKTKAIIVVHYQGYPCEMDEIEEIAKKHNLIIIEDTAQAFGAKYNNKLLGTFGQSAAFSFQSCKIITCGEGGAVTSKVNFDFINRYADNGGYREKDMMPVWDKDFCTYGENFKMTDLQSAILIKQIKKLNKIIQHQRLLYNYITSNITNYNLRESADINGSINMSLCLIFNNKKECSKFISYMNKNNIPFSKRTSNFLPNYNVFKNQVKLNKCKKSYNLLDRSAWLVLNSKLSKLDCKYIIKAMEEYNGK